MSLTPNQVVAYNLPRARLVRGWTQEQAAEALAPFLGTRWSVANFSAIERSVDGGRIRQFTADDLVALSRGFDLPIGFFLTPPASGAEGVRITTPDTKGQGADPVVMMDALLGTDDNFTHLEDTVGTWGAFAGHRAVSRTVGGGTRAGWCPTSCPEPGASPGSEARRSCAGSSVTWRLLATSSRRCSV
ncbi:MAG: helix-turn-helix transcriptional regulator [Actinomycetota bacterium]|nr:helix-turn-helix transcriptional regulator [Actinomycetota bacterium]